MFNQKMQ